jgi:hypothetical protein
MEKRNFIRVVVPIRIHGIFRVAAIFFAENSQKSFRGASLV